MKKLLAILLSIAAIATVGATQLHAQGRDCDTNSVIYCGALTASEFTQKYNQNKTGDLPGLYAHYGINPTAISSAKDGITTKDGRVIVDGKVVATNARSVGRQNMPGSTSFKVGSTTFYERATSTSFASDSISAFVFFDKDGNFTGAILKSCANAVKAIPVPPKPKPVQTAACVSITPTISNRNKVHLTTTATVTNGAKVTGYVFDFGDGKSATTSANMTDHVYAQPGKYTAKVTVKTTLGDRTASTCSTSFTIPPQPLAECKSLIATISNRNDYKLTATSSVSGGATVSAYTFVIKDKSGKVVKTTTQSSPVLTGSLQDGTYTATVTAKTSLGDRNSSACTAGFTISPQPIAECKQLTATISNRTHYTLNALASASGGAKITSYQFVIKDSAGKVVSNVNSTTTMTSGDLTPGAYTAQVTAKTSLGDRTSNSCKTEIAIDVEVCAVPGKETFPANSPNCVENCTVPGKETLPKDSPECVVPPVTPPELPHTGAGDGIGAVIGLSAIVASTGYYVASRRSLLSAMLNR
ncbi:MAG: PKD domain-containing protein [Candidatus Saccharimonadales bacterium]